MHHGKHPVSEVVLRNSEKRQRLVDRKSQRRVYRGDRTWIGFPGGSKVKNLPASEGDGDSIPGSGRCPGRGNGNPLQCSCPEDPGTEEPGGGHPWSGRVAHDLATEQQQPQDLDWARGWEEECLLARRELWGHGAEKRVYRKVFNCWSYCCCATNR